LLEHPVIDPSQYPVHISIPFVETPAGFVTIASQLKISKETAVILDDISSLFKTTVPQDGDVLELEKAKVTSTALWIERKLSDIPDGSQDHLFVQDLIYNSCRIAASIYRKAIVSRIPLSKACSLTELNQLWATMWQVKLSRWKQTPGIFLFILLAVAPAAQHTPHGRFLKNMMKATTLSMVLENWEVVNKSLYTFVNLQRWLRRGSEVTLGLGPQTALELLHFY
jgi:hypothetical protein